MKKFFRLASIIATVTLSACSSTGVKRVVVDSSPDKRDWVGMSRLSFEKDDRIYFRSKQTVLGNQRVNGCYTLAGHDSREAMLRSIVDDMKGATDEAQTDLSESAELILGKVRSGKWEGRIYGFKDDEQYFERYQIRDASTGEKTERIDCYTLSYVSKADYNRTKQEIVNKVVAVDPRIREAITRKQVNFFSNESQSPTSVTEQSSAKGDE
jgi:hypothetical protein